MADQDRPGQQMAETEDARPVMFTGLARYQHFLLPMAGLAIAALAFVVLRGLVHHVSFTQVMEAVRAIPPATLALAVLFTAISFAAVALYDVVAVETIAPGKIPVRVALLAGTTGYAISNALGFAILTGGALRYRIYAAEGIPLPDIGRIVGTSWLAIWFAFAVLLGLALVVDPEGLPWVRAVYPVVEIVAGLLVLAAISAFVLWLARAERTLVVGRLSIRLPSSRGALVQIVAGIIDVCAAAATLYVLLPEHVATGPAAFTLVYVVALIVGIASHAPGGLGAFEATIIAGFGLGTDSQAIAALLAYRVIYTLLPFLVAVIVMVASEALRHRDAVSRHAKGATRILEPLVPPLSAGITFLGGLVLLISTSTPADTDRLATLSSMVPLPFIEVSHLAASFAAVAMLIVARGLARRLARAWAAAMLLFGLGALFALAKGLDWEEAVALSLLCLVLWVFRHSFYRRPVDSVFSMSWGWLASVGAIVFGSLWLGLFAYRHVEYSSELWWQFALDGDAPRFLRGSVITVLLVATVALSIAINRPGRQRSAAVAIPGTVREIVTRSRETGAALALLGDKKFLLDPAGRGFVMYAHSGGSLIALGGPVGDPDVTAELAWAFRDLADRVAARTVFYEVGPANLPLFLDMGLVALKLGEVARVDLTKFTVEGSKRQPLRYAARKADNDGLVFSVVPNTELGPVMGELRSVSDAWLDMKAGSEKSFSLGSFDEAYLANFDVAVMRREGRIIAFANLWRGADKDEMSVDLMRHLPNAPNYLMDALFTKLMLYARDEGYHWFSLGAAPLSGLTGNRLASRWNRFGSFLYRRGSQLYRFDGLKAFKNKFGPVWTPQYLICPPGLDTPRALIDVTTLVSGSPLEFIRK